MSTGILFRHITQPQVQAILLDSILAIDGIIPLLTTFHENMKLIAIGASIIKKNLDNPQPKSRGGLRRTTILLTRLEPTWDPSKLPLLEMSEGKFRLLKSELSLLLLYVQLFILVLRQFPQLSDYTALRDRKLNATFVKLEHKCLERLFQYATALGFKNAKDNI